jgi:hypothetical protein
MALELKHRDKTGDELPPLVFRKAIKRVVVRKWRCADGWSEHTKEMSLPYVSIQHLPEPK